MGADDASSAEMPRRHANRHGLDEETVERLLAGDLPPDEAPPGYGEVAAVLAAMAAPPAADELAGREAALAELRRLHRARPAAAGRWAGRSGRRRRVGLAAVVVVGALAAGGGAAAATGHLPAPVRDVARTILGTVGGEPAAPTSGPGGAPASVTPDPDAGAAGAQGTGSTGTTARAPAGTGSGSAAGSNVPGLCQAYAAGKGGEPGKKLDAAAFQELARAAGGADKIPAYCQQVESGRSGKGKGQQPGDEPNEPTGGPPASTGQDNPGQGGPPTSSNGGQGQGSPATRPNDG
jgi:hypothetical protein